jgi:hypothetical protein
MQDSDPDSKLPSKSDPDPEPKKIIPEHWYRRGILLGQPMPNSFGTARSKIQVERLHEHWLVTALVLLAQPSLFQCCGPEPEPEP